MAPAISLLTIGKVVKTTDAFEPLGHSSYILYDKYGRQVASYDATKHRTSASQYDAVDRVVQSTDTFGQTTTTSYQGSNIANLLALSLDS